MKKLFWVKALSANRVKFLHYIFSDASSKILVFLSIPIYTRILSAAEYGNYSIFNSTSAMLVIILSLNFQSVVTRKYYENNEEFEEFLGTLLITVFILTLLEYLPFVFIFIHLGFSFRILSFLFVISITKAYINIITQTYIAQNKSVKYGITIFLYSFINFALSIIFLLFFNPKTFVLLVYALTLTNFITLLYLLIKEKKTYKLVFKLKFLFYACKFSIPLIAHSLSMLILIQFDRIMINWFYSAKECGLYSLSYNIGMIMSIVVLSINKAWVPSFYSYLNNKKTGKISDNLSYYFNLLTIIFCFAMLFYEPICMFFIPLEFYTSFQIIPIIFFTYVIQFLYFINANYLFYYKKTKLIALITFICALVNVLLNYLLFRHYNYYVASITTLISYLLLFTITQFVNKKVLGSNKIKIGLFLKKLFLMMLIIILYYVSLKLFVIMILSTIVFCFKDLFNDIRRRS